MKIISSLFGLIAVGSAVRHPSVHELGVNEANCFTCQLSAHPKKATYNPMCVNNLGGAGCVASTKAFLGSTFNGCQFCDADNPGVTCDNQFCPRMSGVASSDEFGEAMKNFAISYSQNRQLARQQLQEFLQGHELIKTFLEFAETYLSDRNQALSLIQRWKMTRPDLVQQFKDQIQPRQFSAYPTFPQPIGPVPSTSATESLLEQYLENYANTYLSNPDQARAMLVQWGVSTNPELTGIFQTYAHTLKSNPEQARVQLQQWKLNRQDMFQMFQRIIQKPGMAQPISTAFAQPIASGPIPSTSSGLLLEQYLENYANTYMNNPDQARAMLVQWGVSNPELVGMFQTFAHTMKANPQQARIQLQQWKMNRQDMFQLFQNMIQGAGMVQGQGQNLINADIDVSSTSTAKSIMEQYLKNYGNTYLSNPDQARALLVQWGVSNPELLKMFQTYAHTLKINPEQARIQLQQWKMDPDRQDMLPLFQNMAQGMTSTSLTQQPMAIATTSAFPLFKQYLQNYANAYVMSPEQARMLLVQWAISHPELVQMFEMYAQTFKRDSQQAINQLMQWQATRPDIIQLFQKLIQDGRQSVQQAFPGMEQQQGLTGVVGSGIDQFGGTMDAGDFDKLSKYLQVYANAYMVEPDQARAMLASWMITHPDLVEMFKTYAHTLKINPEQARIQLQHWQKKRMDLLQLFMSQLNEGSMAPKFEL